MAKLTAQERHEKAVKARKAVETMGDSNTEDEKPVEKPASTSSLSSASPLASPVNKKPQRGTFIVLEGLDRCGKSTQTKCIVDALKKEGTEAMALRFPDRTTPIGEMIDGYLKNETELDDRAIHLLFSANRWELCDEIHKQLKKGVTIICDRYAYSGVAFSASKGLSQTWCKSCDAGLPAPDLVLYLDLSMEATKDRGAFSSEVGSRSERYETAQFQKEVYSRFERLRLEVGLERWTNVDAAGTMEDVTSRLMKLVKEKIAALAKIKPRPAPVEMLWDKLDEALRKVEKKRPKGSPDAYEVSKIVEARLTEAGLLEYFVDWVGYSPADRSWVDAADFDDDDGLVLEFYKENPDADGVGRTKGKRKYTTYKPENGSSKKIKKEIKKESSKQKESKKRG